MVWPKILKPGIKKFVSSNGTPDARHSVYSQMTAAEVAVEAIKDTEGTITPFPGGIVASGSKAGFNTYKFMKATANEKFCPSIRDKVEGTEIPEGVKAV